MLTYVIRRILLMIPTIIGITVMVFLIARLAPGRPGQMDLDAGTQSAEAAQAMAEWYERRYGLDLPLYMQYIRWWRGMFFVDALANAWIEGDDGLVPVQTLRRPVPEYYAQRADGQWLQLTQPIVGDVVETTFPQQSEAFLSRIGPAQHELLPEVLEGYAEPTHTFVRASWVEIESLDNVTDRLHFGRIERDFGMLIPAWTDTGDRLYHHPLEAETYIFERGGVWYEYRPRDPFGRWTVLPITDQQLQRVLGREYARLPQAKDGYTIPRHAVAYGQRTELPDRYDANQLERVLHPADAVSPSILWLVTDDEAAPIPLYEQREQVASMFVRTEAGYRRLIGETRVDMPAVSIYRQTSEAFLNRLNDADRERLSQFDPSQREPRHSILEGRLVVPGVQPTERVLRRYQHPATVFQITLGESSASKMTVIDELRNRLPVTLMLSLVAFPLIYLIAIPGGMLMAVKRGKSFDAASNTLMLALWSVPTVLAGTMFIGYLSRGGGWMEWFPNNGLSSVGAESLPFSLWFLDRIWHLILPVTCIVYGGVAYIAKQMRAAMLDNFTMDYVRTARAKGVRQKDIVFRHVLRNSLLPLITIFATILPVLIAGSIIIERIFGIEGMGMLAFRAVVNRDYDVVQSLALIAGLLNLLGLLLADICYALADPRITYK